MFSIARNRLSENTSFKCPSCNAVHRLETVVIGDCTFRVNDVREIFGVTAECPICLDECSEFMVSPCGHIICKDDYQRMGGVMPTSFGSTVPPRRAVRIPSRRADAPTISLVRREPTAATQNGAAVHANLSRRSDVTTATAMTLSSVLNVRDADAFGLTAPPPAPSPVYLTPLEVGRSVTSRPTTSVGDPPTLLAVRVHLMFLQLELVNKRPQPTAFFVLLIVFSVFVDIDIVEDLKLRQILKPALVTCIYSTLLIVIIDQIVEMRLDILVELKLIWAIGMLSILLTFTGTFACGNSLSTIEFVFITFGIGISHFIIFNDVKNLDY